MLAFNYFDLTDNNSNLTDNNSDLTDNNSNLTDYVMLLVVNSAIVFFLIFL